MTLCIHGHDVLTLHGIMTSTVISERSPVGKFYFWTQVIMLPLWQWQGNFFFFGHFNNIIISTHSEHHGFQTMVHSHRLTAIMFGFSLT